MDKETQDPTTRYLMIELSCDEMKCSPCTYPNCQRYVRHLPKNKAFAPKIKPIATKTLEIDTKVEQKLEQNEEPKYPHLVNRYILAELSCSNAKCSPCTYPNCQRYARSNKSPKLKQTMKGPEVNIVELKADEQLGKIIEKKSYN